MPLHLRCNMMFLGAKETPCLNTMHCSERTELWYKHSEFDSCAATAEKAVLFTVTASMFWRLKGDIRAGSASPSITSLTLRYPKVETWRQEADMSRNHLSSPYRMPSSWILSWSRCGNGGWRLYLITTGEWIVSSFTPLLGPLLEYPFEISWELNIII